MENVSYMDRVSICPHRTQVNYEYANWTDIQTTPYTKPLVFTGTKRDLELLEACKVDGPAPPILPYQILGENQISNWVS